MSIITECLPGPNFINKVHLTSVRMNIHAWYKYQHLFTDSDPSLVDQIAFGFPAAIDKSRLPSVPFTNHKSAIRDYQVVDEYIATHTASGVIVGPFPVNPLPVPIIVSPLQVATSASGKKRVVCDMSYGNPSVNDLISGEWSTFPGYFGDFNLPNSDSLAAEILALGAGCKVFKADMTAFYKQLRMDPADVPYTGFTWRQGIYLDLSMPFGMRSSALCAQRVSNGIAIIYYHESGGWTLVAYIDDYAGPAPAAIADRLYALFNKIADELGVDRAKVKCVPPVTLIEFLGLEYDTIELTVALPADKLARVVTLIRDWLSMEQCSKSQLQKLVGVLNHCCYVVHPGKPFTARLLDVLRAKEFPVQLTDDFKLDLQAWLDFLTTEFSGKAMLKNLDFMDADATLRVAVDTQKCAFATQCGPHTKFYMVSDPPPKCNDQFLYACAIYQASTEYSSMLTCNPHLVSVPTKIIEAMVNRAKTDCAIARNLFRKAWIIQARQDFVIKAKFSSEAKSSRLHKQLNKHKHCQKFYCM